MPITTAISAPKKLRTKSQLSHRLGDPKAVFRRQTGVQHRSYLSRDGGRMPVQFRRRREPIPDLCARSRMVMTSAGHDSLSAVAEAS